jgi:SAM-dependent methyltransferase
MTNWFNNENFWIDFYDSMFSENSFKIAENEVDLILNLVKFNGRDVLDLCCGPGRHSIILAKKGYNVTGIDKSKYLLNKVRNKSETEKINIKLIEHDMRDFVQSNSYDLILNLFTSFGYFENQADDLKVIQNIYDNLKKDGKVIIDLMSKEILSRIFSKTTSIALDDGTLLIQIHKIKDDWTKIENDWLLLKDNKYKKYTFSHTVYSSEELKRMLKDIGFKEIKLFGNFKGDEYNNNAQRLILSAVK